MESEFFASHVLFTFSLGPSRQGGTDFTLNETPPISHIASFDWDSLVDPPFPLDLHFQIKVQVEHYMIAHYILDEGTYVSVL